MQKTDKIVKFIDTKILPSGIIPSLLIFTFGSFLFYGFVHDKNISGIPVLIITGICLVLLGVGIYGIFNWMGRKILQLIAFLFRIVFRGQIQLTMDQKGLHSKLHYK